MSQDKVTQLITKPSAESVLEYWQPPFCAGSPLPQSDHSTEIFVLATACFNGVDPRVFDSHRILAMRMGVDYGTNLWIIPSHERMPFPDACTYAVASMMNTEKASGLKADWFLWIEDDMCVPMDTAKRLREAADPDKRPFVVAVGYDRNPPFLPTVWDESGNPDSQWETSPMEGIYKVATTGLTVGLFHRSLFDRIPEPWFASGSPSVREDHGGKHVTKGIKPDMWWCKRMHDADIPIYVHAGVHVTHLSAPLPINHRTAPVFREIASLSKDRFKQTTRGIVVTKAKTGDTNGNLGAVPARLRPGASQSLAGGHAAGSRTWKTVPAREPGGLGDSQAAPAPCSELSGPVGIEQSPELWRGWTPIAECDKT